jgi:hypothetical protein
MVRAFACGLGQGVMIPQKSKSCQRVIEVFNRQLIRGHTYTFGNSCLSVFIVPRKARSRSSRLPNRVAAWATAA